MEDYNYYNFDSYESNLPEYLGGDPDDYGIGDYYDDEESRNDDYYDYGDSPVEQPGEHLDFGPHPKDWGILGAPLIGRNKMYIDPRDKVKSEFKVEFLSCLDKENELHFALEKIDTFTNLVNLNPGVLALSACFDSMYRQRGGINKKNITEFIENKALRVEPADLIRYIIYYNNN